MKSMIIKSAVALIAALPLFTACQGEPEVGTLLHPEEQSSNDPKVYINEISVPANATRASIVQSPAGLVVPEDTYEFYVRITTPVENDVVVTVAEDTEAAAAGAAAYGADKNSALAPGCMAIEKNTVTIPAGKNVSAEPVKFKLTDSEAIRNVSGKAIAAIKITDVKSASKVAVGKDHNAYYTLLDKKVTNFKDFSADLLTKTKLTAADLTYTFQGADYTAKLLDTYTSTWADMWDGPEPIYCEFKTPQPLIGVAYQYGYDAPYGPYTLEIFTSNDGQNWTTQTGGVLETGYTDAVVSINFYSAITCKYVKFIPYTCYYGFSYGDSYNQICVGELYMFK